MKTIDAYKKILKVIKSCAKEAQLDSRVDISYALEVLIIKEDIQESFGINLLSCRDSSITHFKVGDYQWIAKYGSKNNRTISWSDDGKQPEDEWLLAITYPTGAYMFGEDYQKETFEQFFNELKGFSPKYVDTVNHCLYYTADKAKSVYEKIDEITKKFRGVAEENRKESKIEALKKQLEELEKEE